MSHPILARHTDSTSKEIGHGASHSYRCTRETLVQCGPLEMEIGFRLDRRAATYSMLLFRRLIRASLSLGSHPTAVLVVRFIDRLTAGNTWSEVLPLDGTSVFDIEFAPSGTAYIGTQDSVRRSTTAA